MIRKPFKIMIAAALAGTALTACGPVKTGAAALVGNDRITISKLNSTVDEWTKELPKYPAAQQIAQQAQAQGQQVPFDPSSPQRSALYQLVDMKVWDEVARADGVSASGGQVDAIIAQNGGMPTIDANVLAQGLPTRYSRDYVKSVVLRQELMSKYGVTNATDQQSQQQALQQVAGSYQRAGRRLKLEVNPRYGSFDFQHMALGPVCPTLSKPDSGTPTTSGGVSCQA
ncbi:hypothetical protein [Actinoallomurus rhizosphaericola]|uniref:hypothetical protein n=1 Tax=Actinoallomurus rhizosphaericola TaxID=2952536 RepID=UPI00209158C8|nr:hypothetical protein [Actinoallomurus rhizosphaericola]MCO5992777.1 hypothetical protein [Actinoallomurus rhizosphaericola]